MSRKETLKKYNASKKGKDCKRRYVELHKDRVRRQILRWRRKNKEHLNKLSRLRYATPEGKEIRTIIQKRYSDKNKEKAFARNIINREIRYGRMKRKPCIKCGDKKSEGHHVDYNKPLQIIWLCRSCHAKVHYGTNYD